MKLAQLKQNRHCHNQFIYCNTKSQVYQNCGVITDSKQKQVLIIGLHLIIAMILTKNYNNDM